MSDHNLDPRKGSIAFVLAEFIEHGDFTGAVRLVKSGVSGN